MGKSLSAEGRLLRFFTALAVGGTTLGGRPVSSVEAQRPSGPQPQHFSQVCENPGEMSVSYNDKEQGSCLIKKIASGESLELALVADSEMMAWLYFSANDSEASITLIVFGELGEYSPSGSVAPKPGEALQMEYNGLAVTIEGREDDYFVSYTFRPEPKRRPFTPHDPFSPRPRQV